MTGVTSAFEDLVSSIFGVFHQLFNALFASLESVGAVFGTALSSVLDLFNALLGFILGNLAVIGVLVAAFVVYTLVQKRQGQPVATSSKKKN